MSAAEIEPLLAALNLDAPTGAAASLCRYLDLLQQWNGTYNLTAVRDRASMLTQHVADCLAVVPALAARLPAGCVLDVGSGGGLPGVVLAVMRPGWQVTCVDTVAKKAAFVRQVAGSLGLPNLRAVHARVETLPARDFDVVTCRAFAALADFVALTEGRMNPHGVWMAMKARRPDDEIAALPPHVEVFHVEPLKVPGMEADRCLVWMRRKQPAAAPSGAAPG